MGWAIGYDQEHNRDIGYGVPAVCDKPGCFTKIDRGVSYCCSGESEGTDAGCGLYFCGQHLYWTPRGMLCKRCMNYKPPYKRFKNELLEWVLWKARDLSWKEWRLENPKETQALEDRIALEDPDLVKILLKELEPTPDDGIIEGEIVEPQDEQA